MEIKKDNELLEPVMEMKWIFNVASSFKTLLNIIRINLDSMEFILQIIYLK